MPIEEAIFIGVDRANVFRTWRLCNTNVL